MATGRISLTGKIDRRSPRSEGEPNNPVERQNWLARNEVLHKPAGSEKINTTAVSGKLTWCGRYYSRETGIISPKSFYYSTEGKLYFLDNLAGSMTEKKNGLKTDAFPRHAFFQVGTVVNMYLADGKKLWKYNGNNNFTWEDVKLVDIDGNDINPIDVREHKDRLAVLTERTLLMSKNLNPDVFDDPLDSLEVVVGSGRGTNLGFGKILDNDTLYIFNTEGIYAVVGDNISAVAGTWAIQLVDEGKCVAPRSISDVERAILYLGNLGGKIELFSFDGIKSTLKSYSERISDDVNYTKEFLEKAIATYEDNYYKLSVVEKGEVTNNLEIWWDAIEDKIEFIRGRNVGCYLKVDPSEEQYYEEFGRADAGYVMRSSYDIRNFDGSAIECKVRSRDIIPVKYHNVRFTEFRVEIEPTVERNLFIRYLLDGRLSDLSAGELANFNQDLSGEARFLGFIRIKNQSQFSDAINPKISYSKGESIAFELYDLTADTEARVLGIGYDYIKKPAKKNKLVGA